MSDPQPFVLSASSLFGSHFTLPGCTEQSIIISCQDSPVPWTVVFNRKSVQILWKSVLKEHVPVADRNRTNTACGNDWKLLFRFIDVSSSIAIFPNTWRYSLSLYFAFFSFVWLINCKKKKIIIIRLIIIFYLHAYHGINEKQHYD